MKSKKAKFISFEGGEGSGKSTQAKLLYQYLLSSEVPVIHTREIGGTVMGEKIRELILHSELSSMAELLMIVAARYEHLRTLIIPALNSGKWVICDRFVDSTACYQADGANLTMHDIYELHETLMRYEKIEKLADNDNLPSSFPRISKNILPDLTFFIDVAPTIALPRAMKRGHINKFEEKELAFHEKIYQHFQKLAELYSERIVRIEAADKSIMEIQAIIKSKVDSFC